MNTEFLSESYVLTEQDFLRCLLKGMVVEGKIQEVTALNALGRSPIPCDVRLAENGAIVDLSRVIRPELPSVTEAPVGTTIGTPVSTRRRRAPAEVTTQVAQTSGSGGVDPETVKELLKGVMERVPSVATIRNWTEQQREQAIAWSKKAATKPRPEFIVEPAVRKRRTREEIEMANRATSQIGASGAARLHPFEGEDEQDESSVTGA